MLLFVQFLVSHYVAVGSGLCCLFNFKNNLMGVGRYVHRFVWMWESQESSSYLTDRALYRRVREGRLCTQRQGLCVCEIER